MATNVRIFVLEGVATAALASGTRLAYDSVQLLKLPYIARALLTCPDAVTPQNSGVISNNNAASIAFVQVDPGKSVYYELTPGGRTINPADVNSPILRGDSTIIFGPGWQISVMDTGT